MNRVPEPELMDSQEQATAYASTDFSDTDQKFIEDFKSKISVLTWVTSPPLYQTKVYAK